MFQKELNQRRFLKQLKSLKRPTLGFLAGTVLFGNLITPPKQVEAHTGYFLSVIPNVETFSYMPLIVEDSPNAEGNHAEFQFLDGYYLFFDRGNNKDKKSRLPTTIEEYKSQTGSIMGLKGDIGALEAGADTKCMYTFPGCDSKGTNWWDSVAGFVGKFNNDGNGTNLDREAASDVGEAMTQSANEALAYIKRSLMSNATYQEIFSESGVTAKKEELFISISSKFANAARTAAGTVGTDSFTEGGVTFSLNLLDAEEKEKKGLTSPEEKRDKYIQIKASNDSGAGAIFRYSIPRYPSNPGIYKDRAGVSKTLTVFNIIALGNAAHVYGGVTIEKLDGIYNPHWVEKLLSDMLQGILSGLRSLLGLNTMGELIFNDGSYGLKTYLGLAPTSWFQAADVLFWISQIFAWLLLVLASLKFLGVHMWSTVTPFSRMTLMNGIQNIIITAFFLTLIVPIFNIVANFNYLIVGVLRDVSMFNDAMVSGNAFPPTLSGVVLGFFFTLSECVINFMYILRGATLALLYGVSPVFVVAFAFGERYQGITLKFIREMVGNIFIQTFHAVILTFYGLFIFTGGSSGFFVNLVMVFAFIPLTKLFKEITGIGESNFIQGVANEVHGKTTAKGAEMAVNAGKGAVAGAGDGAFGGALDKIGRDKSLNTNLPPAQTTTSTSQDESLSDSKENRSVGDAVGAGESPTTSQSSTTASSRDTASSNSTGDAVSFGNQGGSVNKFGEKEMNMSKSSSTLGATGKATANLAKGVGKLAAGTALGALGGATGAKFLQRAGRQVSGSAYSSLGKVAGYAADKLEQRKFKVGTTPVDEDINGNASAEKHLYDGKAVQEAGVVASGVEKVGGKDCLVQELSADAVENMKGLSDINYDKVTGKVLDQAALDAGITHMSKTDDGNYRIGLDMKKAGVHDFRSMGNGSRFEVKTDVGGGRDDMNFVAAAMSRMNEKVAENQVKDQATNQGKGQSNNSKPSA